MSQLRVAVIGCGHLGRIHARLLSENSSVRLIGVVDPRQEARERVAAEVGTQAAEEIWQLPESIDAAVLAAPTGLHASIATDLLRAGIDLLVEKPLTADARDAEQLCQTAEDQGRVLAVGHVERFNPAFVAATQINVRPQFIQATRAGGFTFRSMDVGVVLDLMIHDIELAMCLADSPPVDVRAQGGSRLTQHEDFAVARVEFQNGCVAQFTASRVCPEAERTMAIYGAAEQVFIDFATRTVRATSTAAAVQLGQLQADQMTPVQIERYRERVFTDLLPLTDAEVADANPLADEQRDFLQAVRQRTQPRVSGRQAAAACDVAEQICGLIHADRGHGGRQRAA